MLKNYRKFLMAGVLAIGLAACGDDVTITDPGTPPAPPETPNIVSFSVAPTTAVIPAGQTLQASSNLQTRAGVAGTIAWSSSNEGVATVDGNGLITAVSNGTALVSAVATAGGQTSTASIGVTVRPIEVASISIESVTRSNLLGNQTPVPLNNVNGQIEINMNYDPGEQIVDSVAVFIGGTRAAKQVYSGASTAGEINLSVNTANFMKNTTTGVATVDFLNGPTTISAAVYPQGGTATATNTINIVLTNADGWAADMTAPAQFANNVDNGLTYWGGPTEDGFTEATLYPVIYTQGRSIQSVTWDIWSDDNGSCDNAMDTELPFRNTFGYEDDGAAVDCEGTEYESGERFNVRVINAIDNTNNAYPTTNLIANTVVPGATPDSLRFDWEAPTTTDMPDVEGAHGFNWVNASWEFEGADAFDDGVGIGDAPDFMVFLTGTDTPAVATGADLAETDTNLEYTLYFTIEDLLGNMAESGDTDEFGVDNTAPVIRYPTDMTLAGVVEYPAGEDTVTYMTAPVLGLPGSQWAVEAIDNRAGLFAAPNGGYTVRGVNQSVIRLAPGSPLQQEVALGVNDDYAAVLFDGYRQTAPVPVWGDSTGTSLATPGYYTYTVTIRDRAGNTTTLANADTTGIPQRRAAIDPDAPVVSGILPPLSYGSDPLNLSGIFTIAAQDDLEVISARLGFTFPDAVTGVGPRPIVFPYGSFPDLGVKYDGTLAGAIATAQNLTTPVLGELTSPDFWAGIQVLCSVDMACAGQEGEPVVAGSTYQPTDVFASVTDVFGTESTPLSSAILSASLPDTEELAANVYNAGAVADTGIEVRYLQDETIRQVSTFSITAPQLARLHAFQLDGTEWVYVGTVAGSAGVGTDNGIERFWDYDFGDAISAAGTYAIVAVYNGPQDQAIGTALWYQFTK